MLKFYTAGESHGQALFAYISGLPAQLPIDLKFINTELHRRQLRSEEHTSELQSQSNLVCRLLLEKKNTNFKSSPSASLTGSRISPLSQTAAVTSPTATQLQPMRVLVPTPPFWLIPTSVVDAAATL